MHGRVCIVTGASSGIGRATARELAARGATVVLVCRDPERGARARAEVAAASPERQAYLELADLASQAEVRRLAVDLLAHHPAIHVLVNNAGVVNLRHTTTVDGIETVFAVNHLAYFLLTHLLQERLAASGGGRIVNVASEVHSMGHVDFDDLGRERRYRAMQVYAQSKLANILFTYELARRLAGVDLTVNCLHPGAVATGLGQNNGRLATLVTRVLRPFFRTPEKGAATAVFLASSPEVADTSGRYFVDCRPKKTSDRSYDTAVAARLWDVSARLTGL
jgi:retinol dehydrogenase-12